MKNKRGIVCVFILAGVLASAIVPGFAYQTEKSNRGAITDIVQTAGGCGDTEIGKTKGMGAEAAEAEAKAPDQAQIEGFSLIMQMPELPTGCEITALTMMLDHYGYAVDKTVMVWVTIGMADRREVQGWYTEAGEFMDWSTNDHGAVLIGYSPETVTIADPISGICEYDREQFEKVFASRGNQCVILREAA